IKSQQPRNYPSYLDIRHIYAQLVLAFEGGARSIENVNRPVDKLQHLAQRQVIAGVMLCELTQFLSLSFEDMQAAVLIDFELRLLRGAIHCLGARQAYNAGKNAVGDHHDARGVSLYRVLMFEFLNLTCQDGNENQLEHKGNGNQNQSLLSQADRVS